MKRMVKVVLIMTVVLTMVSSVAFAATIIGTNGPDSISGTKNATRSTAGAATTL